MATQTADEMIAARQRELEAERKLKDEPAALTAADLDDLPPRMLADAMGRGDLRHLGYGARSGQRR